MIINKVRPAPFGALSSEEYTFGRGLNVLLGPNEAGKSTLINAIFAALFTPSNVRKSSDDWKKTIQNSMPHPGGDTARVELEFEDETQGAITYSCSWGASKDNRLVISGEIEINDPEEIQSRLQKSLRYGRATYQAVLFARQEEMNQTFTRLKKNPEATASLSDLLRSALFEAGGVSLAKLEELLVEEYRRLFQNWDLDLDGPRGGRDINNPYKKQVGKILQAYYWKEQLRRKLNETLALEEQFDEKSRQLSEANQKKEQLKQQLKEMEKLEDDMRQRSKLEPALESAREKENRLRKVMAEWPRVEERVQSLENECAAQEKQLKKLQEELQEAEAILNARETRNLLQRAKPLLEEIKRHEQSLSQTPHLNEEDLQYLENKQQEHERQKAVAEAMKLKASIQTKIPLELTVTSGMEQTRKIVVEQEELLQGNGRLLLESADWKINIQSGEKDVEKLIKQAERAKEDFKVKLEEFALKELEEARSIVNKRNEVKSALDKNRFRLKELLGDLSFEEIENKVSEQGPDKSVRDPEQIKADLEESKVQLETLKYKLEQEKGKLEEWQNEYTSTDELMRKLVAYNRETEDIGEKLNKLAPLPQEYNSIDQFFVKLKEMRSESERIREQIDALKAELIEVQRKMPDESTEELEAAWKEAESKFARLRKRGQAVNTIWEEFRNLKEELDTDTYKPLADSFAHYLSLSTNNRYNLAELDGALPGRITSVQKGQTMPVNLLSAGTTSGAALALRLAMAEYLLQELNGFLVMDDPLVNLDPERRQSAARAIREFADNKQMLVATCDPDTADLLGGRIVSV
ncbi:MAG: AAA family ATPase [Bacillota bacterium]